MLRLTGSTLIVPLSVAANAGWCVAQGFGVQLHGLRFDEYVDTLVDLYVGRHSLNGKQS